MRDEQRPLPGAIVVQDVHDLYRSVGLPRPWWAHHHGEARLDTSHYGLDLSGYGWEEVEGGYRRSEEVGGGWRRVEEVEGGWRRLKEVEGGCRMREGIGVCYLSRLHTQES